MRRLTLGFTITTLLLTGHALAEVPPETPPPPATVAETSPPTAIVAPPAPVATPPSQPLGFAEAKTRAERNIPSQRFVLNSLTIFRWNPLGLEEQIRAGYQLKLYKSYDAMFRDNFVHLGVYPRINPAFIKIGPSLEIQPLSIFNLRVAIEYMEFFSTFGFMQSWASPLSVADGGGSDYSDTAFQDNRNQKRNYSTSGFHVMIEPLIQLQLGPVVIRNKFAAEYWNMRLNPGDTVWYDATLDTLVPKSGWVITNDLDLMYSRNFSTKLGTGTLRVGARYSMVQPFYNKSDYKPGEAEKANNSHHRVGPILAYTFYDRGFTRFNKPTLLAIANWYLRHQYRTGADSAVAIPYLVVGFAFQSDLMQ